MPIIRVASDDDYGSYSHPELYFLVDARFVRFWASRGAKFPKMGDSLPMTPMNHRAKFDVTSFTLAREIANCTKQTVNDISTPCQSALSACVDNKVSTT